MIRVVLERKQFDAYASDTSRDLFTIDIESPELESHLRFGGRGPSGWEAVRVLGACVLPQGEPADE